MSSNRDRIIIDKEGDWQRFVQILQPYQAALGTVKVGTSREGALVFDKNLDAFVLLSGLGTTHYLNQRKVRAALGLPEPVGKPRMGYEVREVYTLRLEPTLAEYVRQLGDGNLSAGFTKLAEAHRDRAQRRQAED